MASGFVMAELSTCNDHLFGTELLIRFTACAFRKLLSINIFSYFPFGFEGRMWDLIVSVPDHCLSFYLVGMVAPGHISAALQIGFAFGFWTHSLSLEMDEWSGFF